MVKIAAKRAVLLTVIFLFLLPILLLRGAPPYENFHWMSADHSVITAQALLRQDLSKFGLAVIYVSLAVFFYLYLSKRESNMCIYILCYCYVRLLIT